MVPNNPKLPLIPFLLFLINILFHFTYQVIVQGLRESGVFTSVIQSAQTTLSKDKFLESIDSSNSSRTVASELDPSRKVGRSKEYQATLRKVLDIEAKSYEAAVPPLSPPGFNDDHLIDM